MSLIMRTSLANNATEKRAMQEQYKELTMLRNSSLQDLQQMLNITNAARTPEQAYLEFDSTTKIDQVPAGEFATLTRANQVSRSVSIGREVFEYRQSSIAGNGQTSMSGQIGVKLDHVDYSYAGTIVPIHDIGYGLRYRTAEAMRADGFDGLVDNARETERELMRTMDNYLWDGDANIVVQDRSWLGLKADPSVVNATINVNLAMPTTSATNIRNEITRLRDILYITNNCTHDLSLVVSREIMSNWERPFTTEDGTFGTILEYVMKLRGLKEVIEDSRLVGNEIAILWFDQQGFHPVVGMGISSYAIPRQLPNADFNFVKWAAVGFLAKQDAAGRKCALYAD